MPRIPTIPLDKMTAAQRALYDKVLRQRGRVRGPFNVLIHAPEIGDPVVELIDYLNGETRAPKGMKELAILTIARHYTAQYEWLVHEPGARKGGVPDAVIEAIRNRREPEIADPGQAVAYAMAKEFLNQGKVSDATYARGVAILGEPTMVEFVVHLGFYVAVAALLVIFDVGVPADETPPLAP